MTVGELLSKVKFQEDFIIFCYYDIKEFERKIITKEEAISEYVYSIYVEGDELYIEVDKYEEQKTD